MVTKILVPTDFSEPSCKGLDYAIELARRVRARLMVVVVVEPIQYTVPPDLSGTISNTGMLLPEQQKIAKQQLVKLAKRLQQRGLRFQTLLATGTPHERIVEAAKRFKADLIVMATHGRGGLSHFLLGSVAEKVVRTAPCPVLTVRDIKPSRQRLSTAGTGAQRKQSGRSVAART